MKITICALFILMLILACKDIPREASKYVVSFTYKINHIYGSGFRINYKGSKYIITNRHVCEAGKRIFNNPIEIRVNMKLTRIIKIWKKHDLCALESDSFDGLMLANSAPSNLDIIYLIGHPRGLPLVIRSGRIVGKTKIMLPSYPSMDAVRISALAYGGNSGSPVINENGKVVGVLFAGSPAYPHEPFIVPHSILKEFLEELYDKDRYKIIKRSTRIRRGMLI